MTDQKDPVGITERDLQGDKNTVFVHKEPEPRKPAREILTQQIVEGLAETERSTSGLILSGISAGLDLGFSALLIGVVRSLNVSGLQPIVQEIFVAIAYSIGFLFVVIGRTSLFTEHTTLAILPVLNRSSSIWKLFRLWGLVYVSNLTGGAIFALLISRVGPDMGTIHPDAFRQMAQVNVAHPALVILLSAILAGWLMGLLSWLVTASRDTTAQIIVILIITGTIGLAHLQHSIAGSIEVFAAIFANTGITWGEYGHFLLWTTLGNIIGGTVFVAAIKYAGAVRSNPNRPIVSVDDE